jgi:hypothetical protein
VVLAVLHQIAELPSKDIVEVTENVVLLAQNCTSGAKVLDAQTPETMSSSPDVAALR